MKHVSRWAVLAAALAIFYSTSCIFPAVAAEFPPRTGQRAVELTFLKSRAGERENLKQFIVLNWFAMDKTAKAQGLIDTFTVMDSGSDDGTWNVLVAVSYPDERGYRGIAEAFEKIRKAHTTVPVHGKKLAELGLIVESRSMLENPAHATR